jgi:CHASE3 domain sensor protein
MAELRRTVDLRRNGQMNDAVAIVLSDKGKDLMDRMRQTICMMRSEEARLLFARQDEARQKALLIQYGAFAALVLSLLMSVSVFRSLRRQFASVAQAYQTLNETHTALASAIRRQAIPSLMKCGLRSSE